MISRMETLAQMAAVSSVILLAWTILALVSTGIGLAIGRGCGNRSFDTRRMVLAHWVGFAVIIAFLQVWHLILPVRWPAAALIFAAGVVGCLGSRRRLRHWWRIALAKGNRGFLAAWLVLGLWMANQAMGPGTLFDSGTYHVQSVRWIRAYAIVPGLGNLHSHLGFNSASHLWAAALNAGPWADRGYHIANSSLLFVLLGQVLLGVRQFVSQTHEGGSRLGATFDAVLLPLVIALMFFAEHRSYSTDYPVAIIVLVSASELYRLLTDHDLEKGEISYRMMVVGWLLILAVCLKSSALVFSLVAGGVAIATWWVRARPDRSERRRILFGLAVGAAGLLAVWLARGVILTGYPAYPSGFGAVPVAWKVPTELQEADASWIANHLQYVSADQSGRGWHEWPLPWIQLLLPTSEGWIRLLAPFLIAVAGAAGVLWTRLRSWVARAPPQQGWVVLIPAVGSILFVFMVAPSARFSFPFFWIVAAACAGPYLARLGARFPPLACGILAAATLLVGTLPVTMPVAKARVGQTDLSLPALADSMLHRALVMPGTDHGLHTLPSVRLRTYTTWSGLELNVPASEYSVHCWNAELPCTPHPAPNLRLRKDGSLGSGFLTDGPWAQERWPAPWSSYKAFFECRRRPSMSGDVDVDSLCFVQAIETGESR